MRMVTNVSANRLCSAPGGARPMCAWWWLLAWAFVAGVAVYVCQAYVDVHTAAWSRWAGFDPVRGAFEIISQLGRSLWYIASFGVLAPLAFVLGARHLARRFLFLLVAVLATGLLVQGAKVVAGRLRPKALVDDGLYGFTWFDFGYETASFPSGHTATIAALAAAMWVLVPRWRDLWVLPVMAMGAARLLGGSHFLSDVIAGAFVGGATTYLVYRAFRSRGALALDGSSSRPMTASVTQSPVE